MGTTPRKKRRLPTAPPYLANSKPQWMAPRKERMMAPYEICTFCACRSSAEAVSKDMEESRPRTLKSATQERGEGERLTLGDELGLPRQVDGGAGGRDVGNHTCVAHRSVQAWRAGRGRDDAPAAPQSSAGRGMAWNISPEMVFCSGVEEGV